MGKQIQAVGVFIFMTTVTCRMLTCRITSQHPQQHGEEHDPGSILKVTGSIRWCHVSCTRVIACPAVPPDLLLARGTRVVTIMDTQPQRYKQVLSL